MEIWKPIKNFELFYEVSNHGRVRSSGSHKRGGKGACILRPGLRGKGYLHVVLSNGEVIKSFSVHRLVAEAFIDNPKNLPEVNHKDRDKLNNFSNNLEWCCTQYNVEYSQSVKCTIISPDGELVEVFNISRFIRDNSFSRGHFYDMLKGRTVQYRGWTLPV